MKHGKGLCFIIKVLLDFQTSSNRKFSYLIQIFFRYKSAVLQHKIDPDSFVYSVPHDDKDETKEEGELKVTASHAIFRTDGLKKAPGCVVGFQFKYELMGQRFQNITTTDNVSMTKNIRFILVLIFSKKNFTV